jgi:3-hydroxyisobutyrate dehydrogenase-like beta-hydroxyacid dehydrogenase
MKVAVVGLGAMGLNIARNLLAKSHAVVGCDVRESARKALVELGGASVARGRDLPPDTEAVVLFVVNAAQVRDVLFGADGCASVLAPGTLILTCTTMQPDDARGIAEQCGAAGLVMLESPVSGGVAGARAGTLTIMGAGPADAFDRARPVFEAIGSRVFSLGSDYGAGNTMKMVNQLLVGVHIAASAEAMALGIRAGLDPAKVFEIVSASAGTSWIWQDRIPQILAGDDSPFSTVGIFMKDLGIVLDEGRALSFPLPLAATAHQLFLAAAAAGQKDKGDSFVIRVWETLAGIPLPGPPGVESG